MRTFTNEECRFAYRDSIFKREAKGKYIITSITLKLAKSKAKHAAKKAKHAKKVHVKKK